MNGQKKRRMGAISTLTLALPYTYVTLYLFWALLPSIGGIASAAYYAGVVILVTFAFLHKLVAHSPDRVEVAYIAALIGWTAVSAYSYQVYPPSSRPHPFYGMLLEGPTIFFINLLVLLLGMRYAEAYITISKRKVQLLLLVVMLTSSYYLLRAVMLFPDALRARGSLAESGDFSILFGAPNYAMIYGFAILLPVFCGYYLSNRKKMRGKERWAMRLIIASLMMMVVMSAFATAALALVLGMGVLLFNRCSSRGKVLLLVVALPAAGLLLFTDALSAVLLGLSPVLEVVSPSWAVKFKEMGWAFHSQGEAAGDMATRGNLYASSWEAFAQSPLLGNMGGIVRHIGGHSTALDILGQTGLLGFSLFVCVIVSAFQRMKKFATYPQHKSVVYACYVIFIAIVLTKNTITSFCIYAAILGLLPVFYRMYFEKE